MGDTIMSAEEITSKKYCEKQRLKCYAHNIQPIMDKLDKFENKIDEIKDTVLEMPYQLRKEFDNVYAEKRVEKNFDKLVWMVLSAVVLGVLNLVVK